MFYHIPSFPGRESDVLSSVEVSLPQLSVLLERMAVEPLDLLHDHCLSLAGLLIRNWKAISTTHDEASRNRTRRAIATSFPPLESVTLTALRGEGDITELSD